eukprot:EG_transcript_8636
MSAFDSTLGDYVETVQGTPSKLIGVAAFAGLSIFLGWNAFLLPSMLTDGAAQLTELVVDCIVAGDGTRLEICCGCNRKSIRRRKNCGCCDCTRNLLFGITPGVTGGIIELACFLGNLGSDLSNFVDMLYGDFWPHNFGMVVVWSDLLQVIFNLPLAFCLHHRAVNSWRFAIASATWCSFRAIYQIRSAALETFDFIAYALTQFLGLYAISLIMYADAPLLNRKIIPTSNEYREHYEQEPDWDLPAPPEPEPEKGLPEDDDKDAWWNTPFLSKVKEEFHALQGTISNSASSPAAADSHGAPSGPPAASSSPAPPLHDLETLGPKEEATGAEGGDMLAMEPATTELAGEPAGKEVEAPPEKPKSVDEEAAGDGSDAEVVVEAPSPEPEATAAGGAEGGVEGSREPEKEPSAFQKLFRGGGSSSGS